VPAHHQTTSVLMNVWVQAYNTNLIKKEELPKKYEDLLDPKWKGKLGIEAKSDNWYGTVLAALGEEKGTKLLHDIVAKNGMASRLGMSLVNNMVVAGETPLTLTIYADLPEKGKKKGQPIDWFTIDPVIAEGFDIGIAAKSPHPNAAALFYEYMLSPETQKLLASLYYYPTRKGVEGLIQHKTIKVVDPVAAIDNVAKWSKSFDANVTKQPK
jgi:iron(III) transport system substrate-binding protein